jgi:hypothetical protein
MQAGVGSVVCRGDIITLPGPVPTHVHESWLRLTAVGAAVGAGVGAGVGACP